LALVIAYSLKHCQAECFGWWAALDSNPVEPQDLAFSSSGIGRGPGI
jgi:hypothetical protein